MPEPLTLRTVVPLYCIAPIQSGGTAPKPYRQQSHQCAFLCLCMCMCVYVHCIFHLFVLYVFAYFSKEAALIVLPGASSDVDKEQVPLGS